MDPKDERGQPTPEAYNDEQNEAEAIVIQGNFEKAIAIKEVQPLLDDLITYCKAPANEDIDLVFTLVLELNHELIKRGSRISRENISEKILHEAALKAFQTIHDELKDTAENGPPAWARDAEPNGDEEPPAPEDVPPAAQPKAEEEPPAKKEDTPAPVEAPAEETPAAAPAETGHADEDEPQPRIKTFTEDIKAQAMKASAVLVALDPLSRKLLEERPKPDITPQHWNIETFKGAPATRKRPEVPPGIVGLTLSLDPNELQTTYPDEVPVHIFGEFSYYDMRFSLAYQALWEECEAQNIPLEKRAFSIAELCKHMTANKSRPAAYQMRRARETAEKLMFLRMQIDTHGEKHLRNHSRSRVSAFLPAELHIGKMNDNETVLMIPYREAPLFTFAKERGQFTTVPLSVFNESPLSLTEENMNIEYYILTRISKMNYSSDWEPVIKIDTFLKECGLPPVKGRTPEAAKYRQRKKRALANAEKWLRHLKKNGLILDFTIEKDCFTITPKHGKEKHIATKQK